MLFDFSKAVILAGIPIAVISYYLILFTSKKTSIVSRNSRHYKQELKTLEFDGNDSGFFEKIVQKKIIKFGGGFYGEMTLITYVHIEFYQLIDFIRNFSSISSFLDSIGISMIVNFFIEAIMNLISAFLWPLYWFKYMPVGSFWVWLVVAIVAHTLGTRYALAQVALKR